jgi:hypothetical protein
VRKRGFVGGDRHSSSLRIGHLAAARPAKQWDPSVLAMLPVLATFVIINVHIHDNVRIYSCQASAALASWLRPDALIRSAREALSP